MGNEKETVAVSNTNEFIRFKALSRLDRLDVTRHVTNRDTKRHEKGER